MKTRGKIALALASLMLLAGCNMSADKMKDLVEKNPEILFNAIEKHPAAFMKVVNEAVRNAQVNAREEQAKKEAGQLEGEFKDPKKPKIDDSRVFFGPKSAPITIVEYSDFECPFCVRGFTTIKEVMKEYGDKVRVLYKHLPLDMHPNARPAAEYYEAIGLQDPAKAKKFHDALFENQSKLKKEGVKYLKALTKKVGANLSKVEKDAKGEVVQARIKSDIDEASKYEFTGTPGFLINGVSLKGAYPLPNFKKIIDRHLKEMSQG